MPNSVWEPWASSSIRGEGLDCEGACSDVALDAQDPFGQQGRQLAITQEPAGGLEVAGGAAWR